MAAKPTNAEQHLLPVGGMTTSRHPIPLASANKGQKTNFPPSEHWPLFWKQTFKEYPQLFDSSSSECKLSNSHMKSIKIHLLSTQAPRMKNTSRKETRMPGMKSSCQYCRQTSPLDIQWRRRPLISRSNQDHRSPFHPFRQWSLVRRSSIQALR